MKKDDTNSNKLGFMRVLQVFFSINVALSLGLLVFTVKGSHELDFAEILSLINLVFDGVSLWLIAQRKNAARVFIIGFSLFNIVGGSVYGLATGSFNLFAQLGSSSLDIVLIVYFLTSKRAKAVLTQPFSLETKRIHLAEAQSYFQPKTWAFWRNIIIYFCVFSVVGHWMEAGYCTLIRFGLLPGIYDPTSQIWHDWLYPFVVYGFGAVACVLLLYPVKNFLHKHIRGSVGPLLLSFMVNALVCTAIELTMGLMLNQPLPDGTLPLWDYRNMFCNFMGQVCLQNAVGFGLVATLMTWVIYPGLEKLISLLSKDVMNVVFIAVVVGFCVLFLQYCINIVLPDSNASFALQALEAAEN